MLKEFINLFAGQMNERATLLAFHVVAVAMLAMLCTYVFVAGR